MKKRPCPVCSGYRHHPSKLFSWIIMVDGSEYMAPSLQPCIACDATGLAESSRPRPLFEDLPPATLQRIIESHGGPLKAWNRIGPRKTKT